jgi:1-deoxy-D-xylulose-5-phosphate reductoisomerase
LIKGVSILGSTGSIGRQALEVSDRFPDLFRVGGLSAGRNAGLFREQIKKYRPKIASLLKKEDALALSAGTGPGGPSFSWGREGLEAVSTCPEADIVLTAVTGTAGLAPTVAAVKAGKDIALANKETLVAAGSVVMELAARHGVNILPVDSEHSAIWQSLRGAAPEEVDSLILTASGGPFLDSPGI